MPSTSAIVSRIQELAHGWNRTGTRGILPLLDDVNRYMVGHDSETNVPLSSSTGLFPYLVTTAGTFEYDAPSDCRKVAKVLVLSSASRGYDKWSSYERVTYQGTQFLAVPVRTRPKNRNDDAKIYFRSDPGSTTETYYLKYYKSPTAISSVNVNLDVPDEYHDLVIDGVIARIRQIEYGEQQQYLIWRNERVSNEYWQETNDNADTTSMMNLRNF